LSDPIAKADRDVGKQIGMTPIAVVSRLMFFDREEVVPIRPGGK